MIFLLLAASASGFSNDENALITVDFGNEYQVIDNFGASDCWSMQMLGGWSLENRNRVADLLFSRDKGIGLSCWRFNLGAGKKTDDIRNPWRTAETFEVSEGVYDWSRQKGEQWFLGAAKERGVEQFVAFVNSPPARMTRNGLTRCTSEVGSTNLKEGYEGQYARYITDILQHFRDNPDESCRIDFDWISPVNEPQWDWNESSQEGNRAGNEDIKRIVLALHEELKRREIETKILAPESGHLLGMWGSHLDMYVKYGVRYGNYIDLFCSDPDLKKKTGNVLCAHSYWVNSLPDTIIKSRQRMQKKMEQYPGWRYWQTEFCIMEGKRDLGMETALNVARVIHYDMTLCNASAWQWWTAVSPCNFKDGLVFTDYRKEGDPETIYPSKTLWTLGNFSRFIRPGAKRIDLKGADNLDGLLGSAYKCPDGNTVVIVLINMQDIDEIVSLKVKGISGKRKVNRFIPYITSDLGYLAEGPPIAHDKAYSVPGRSVVTLVGTRFSGMIE